ncbi:flavodoxin domain-containing protein [Cellulomonas fimi]|uniref:Flavodoxin-like protein n=1 Tax=Cellulomonas fimi (strain ATCC 484 / DSM 20113 / JCM 1341 / CCUG 24087 / LMG 16345 / NBRC 15513 / NCIMB 8980 / NCTC 7547 / NRS-133) TaxID=590998 RepID=F4H249_CELFA|nr:flavodoxin domain-containing protein [Cellulomonas fimi]AEE46346.1 flavodoxin-like protein [Cellulomonas fimi ATCC 484]NNH07146.1 flavodoxin [Cellulomonas fimi]VEH32615.1 Protoporphyrinogen IX dehydrogenase [menaquinone] [Cellulomonas fimi]
MKILMTVASRHGGTREIGEVVAQTLRDAGHDVDETSPDDVEHVTGYDAVVIGSAVYVGRLAASVRDLVERQGAHLRSMPVWLFWSGPVGDPPMPPTVPDDVDVVAEHAGARETRCFVGRIERSELNLNERALVALVRAETGDYRDFEDVRSWADELVQRLAELDRVG